MNKVIFVLGVLSVVCGDSWGMEHSKQVKSQYKSLSSGEKKEQHMFSAEKNREFHDLSAELDMAQKYLDKCMENLSSEVKSRSLSVEVKKQRSQHLDEVALWVDTLLTKLTDEFLSVVDASFLDGAKNKKNNIVTEKNRLLEIVSHGGSQGERFMRGPITQPAHTTNSKSGTSGLRGLIDRFRANKKEVLEPREGGAAQQDEHSVKLGGSEFVERETVSQETRQQISEGEEEGALSHRRSLRGSFDEGDPLANNQKVYEENRLWARHEGLLAEANYLFDRCKDTRAFDLMLFNDLQVMHDNHSYIVREIIKLDPRYKNMLEQKIEETYHKMFELLKRAEGFEDDL